ncbi:MAG: SPASM domain-containing protein, partial [Candidatus Omnitrophica bacterium]|nr:SPASM domain-containing protein [Candidatus Omnitrophota bacterium]
SFVSDGESTCSPYLYDAITHGYGKGLDMALGTNGFLLKRDKLSEILPCLTYLRFNISAGTRDAYAKVMGCDVTCYDQVMGTIRACVDLKKKNGWPVTIGLQMVLLPKYADQIIPLARLGSELGVDYLVIKHCSDDENGALGVDYAAYHQLSEVIKEAEALSRPDYQVSAKWSKILSDGKRSYSQCYGPPFILQISGSGLVAPCGFLFNDKYNQYHIGNIVDTSFKEIWQSDRYWQVMDLITSKKFDAKTMCGTLCLQHKVNECLAGLKAGGKFPEPGEKAPQHINFI